MRVLHNLPTRPDEDTGDTFNFQQWMGGIRRAPMGSGAGGGAERAPILSLNWCTTATTSQMHCTATTHTWSTDPQAQESAPSCSKVNWSTTTGHGCYLLYLLPRWLLVKPRGKRQLTAREIRGRVDSFMANEWKTLDKTARLAGTAPTMRKRSSPGSSSDNRNEPACIREEQTRTQTKSHQKSG